MYRRLQFDGELYWAIIGERAELQLDGHDGVPYR
jgi:hypothetical protein